MTVPGDPTSRDPADPFGSGPAGSPPASAPTTAPTTAALPGTDGSTPTPTAPSTPATPESGTESGGGAKVKAAALVAGAGALLNKLRKQAPKKAREVREKRVAGRCVLLTEVASSPVAIGPPTATSRPPART